jgi:dTDP-4-dehydrorhamnose reductase
VRKLVSNIQPEVIINTAALTDVDACEEQPDAAFEVNAISVGYLASAAKATGAFLVQVSTDGVFDGKKGHYSEDDTPNPINQYGLSKLKGEQAATNAGAGNWSIARASVVYGWGRPHRPNAATYVYRKLSKAENVSMVTDIYSTPTLNSNLARMLLDIAQLKLPGIIHTAGTTRLSRFDFALRLAETLQLDSSLIFPVKAQTMNWKARRPADSSLNVSKASQNLSNRPLDIDNALELLLEEYKLLSRPEIPT